MTIAVSRPAVGTIVVTADVTHPVVAVAVATMTMIAGIHRAMMTVTVVVVVIVTTALAGTATITPPAVSTVMHPVTIDTLDARNAVPQGMPVTPAMANAMRAIPVATLVNQLSLRLRLAKVAGLMVAVPTGMSHAPTIVVTGDRWFVLRQRDPKAFHSTSRIPCSFCFDFVYPACSLVHSTFLPFVFLNNFFRLSCPVILYFLFFPFFSFGENWSLFWKGKLTSSSDTSPDSD